MSTTPRRWSIRRPASADLAGSIYASISMCSQYIQGVSPFSGELDKTSPEQPARQPSHDEKSVESEQKNERAGLNPFLPSLVNLAALSAWLWLVLRNIH